MISQSHFGISLVSEGQNAAPHSRSNTLCVQRVAVPVEPSGELLHRKKSDIGPETLEIWFDGTNLYFLFGKSGAELTPCALNLWGGLSEHLLERVILPTALWMELGSAVMVHGSLIATPGDRRVVLLVGPSGIGKSSLAYALAQRNWAHGSDDLVVVDVELQTAHGAGSGVLLRGPIEPGQRLDGQLTREGKVRVRDVRRFESGELALVVFLKRGTGLKSCKVTASESYLEILKSSFRFEPGSPSIHKKRSRSARMLVDRIPSFVLQVPENTDGPYPFAVPAVESKLMQLLERES